MCAFENLKPGIRLRGLDPAGIAEVVQVTRFGPDALNLVFRVDGKVGERLVYRGEESSFEFLETGRSYGFDADGSLLRLASEAYRIRLAYLFDPYLAVSASQIEALPHQITAVYGEMLPRQPLRFLLADDPGAGKTIMAGLLIKELLIRGDLERCLIVAPGSLVEQWQDEMSEKFVLGFDILTRDQIEGSITGNPFVEKNRLILRLDMAARSDELKAKLQAAPDWDLVICDEAHRMAASYFGGEVKETQRHVREEMNRADRTGDDKRRMNVGFALQILQRRLASSPAAIHRSLERRRKRLEERLREERLMRQGGPAPLARSPELPIDLTEGLRCPLLGVGIDLTLIVHDDIATPAIDGGIDRVELAGAQICVTTAGAESDDADLARAIGLRPQKRDSSSDVTHHLIVCDTSDARSAAVKAHASHCCGMTQSLHFSADIARTRTSPLWSPFTQYSSASMMVSTRSVTAGSAGSGE